MTDPLHDLETLRREFRNAAAERYDNGANEADGDAMVLGRMAETVRIATRHFVADADALSIVRPGAISPIRLRDVLAEAVADELHLTPEAARVFLAMVRA